MRVVAGRSKAVHAERQAKAQEQPEQEAAKQEEAKAEQAQAASGHGRHEEL
eukprot:COSAG04_NODE_2162_length_4649_cov_8.389231_2_plen_51_part_00